MLVIGSALLATIVLFILSIILALVLGDLYISFMTVIIFTIILCTIYGSQYVVQEVKKLLEEKQK